MINRVVLVGHTTKELELQKTSTDKAYLKFTLAINKFNDEVDFIQCVAWNKSAEFLAQYGKKGSLVGVDGRISTRTYDDKDGKKVYVTEVVADQVNLLDKRETKPEPKFDTGKTNLVKEDDLPF